MSREPFDLLSFPLSGKRLIEASAGTGKTFSLAGIYLRLLVERRLDVRDILVMTFTRAATQELRERIRARLTVAAQLATDPDRAEPGNTEHRIALDLIARACAGQEPDGEPREQIARRLRSAAARMDEATISTIHGFAQQAAQENAFDSALPFDRGSQVDDPPLHLEACTDYWRSQVLGCPQAQSRSFLELWPKPEQLYGDLKEALERPQVQIWGPTDAALEARVERARALWATDQRQLGALIEEAAQRGKLLKGGGLNKALDAAGSVEALLARVADGLAGTASGHAILPQWLIELGSADGTARHFFKNSLGTYRPQELELVQALAALAPASRQAALETALADIRASIHQRKRAGRQFSFADMIEALHGAVTHPERGADLAAALHDTWRYALVDEFQDTDPLQYQILHAIYHDRDDGALIMIGDPKQAIYAFRGGDVFAYLQAARDADGIYTLNRNFRSGAGVLAGIEALFRGPAAATEDGEFLVSDIRFQPVDSGRRPDDRVLVRDGAPLPAVTAWALGGDDLNKDDARQALTNATVSEICALLDPAAESGARLRTAEGAETPVRAGQIAVLVNTNREAADVQRALARRGVAAVCLHRASVFESGEADDLLYLLRAADSAGRPEAVRAALATPLLGLRMADLLALSADDAAWHAHVARIQDLHETWRSRGLLAMVEPLLQQAAPRLLTLEDGERRMTNYLQLAELLAHAETETFGFAGLIDWLAAQMAHPQVDAEVESQQLKLESDEELVRITTVHRAKGLQFPIVFVPFAPLQPVRAPQPPWVFHDADGRAWLDFALDGTTRKPVASREIRAESLRLLYVALTRAEDACYFGWAAANGAHNTALAWLLHAGDGVTPNEISAPRKPPDWLTAASVADRLQALAARAAGAARVSAPPQPLATGFRVSPGTPPAGTARTDLPAPRRDWSVFSFSRLVAGGRHGAAQGGAEDELLALPATGADGDDGVSPPVVTVAPGATPADADALPAATAIALRGPAFGTAIHLLLEAIEDPAGWPAPGTAPGERERGLAARHLHNAGLPLGDGAERRALLDAVCAMVARTLHTPLPDIGPLARLPASRRLVEMEFFLRLGGEQVGRVLDALHDHGYAVSLAPERVALTLRGLMQGFIDLTVEAGGRYWVVDYKTNDLGPARSAYQGDGLNRAVRHGHYDLQYLIYLVALHRHLDHTLPDYDPATHLAGAQYLFLRGLDGTSADTGVYVDTPPPSLIATLDTVLSGSRMHQ